MPIARPRWLAVLVLCLGSVAPAQTIDGSVGKVPADTLFFASSPRFGEQVDAFLKSNAYAKLRSLPAAKLLFEQARRELGQPGNDFSQIIRFFQAPENAELNATLLDLIRNEVFMYCGEETVKLLQVAGDMSFSSRFDRILRRARANADPDGAIRNVFETLKDNLDKIVAPDFVIGFRATKPDAARSQVARLEKFLQEQMKNAPPEIRDRLKRTRVGDADALVFSVDGSLVPWTEINIERFEEEKGQFKDVVEKLKKITFAVTIAVKGEYVLVTLGGDSRAVEKFGAGPALAGLPEFAPLRKFADRRICGIGYTSKRIGELLGTSKADITEMVKEFKEGLNEAPISDELRKKIAADLEKLGGEIIADIVPPSAVLSFQFLTDDGVEAYDYDYRETKSAPLTIHNQLGGAPLFAYAVRGGDATPAYRTTVRWLTTFWGHAESAIKELADENQFEQFQAGFKMVLPYLQRFNDHTGGELLPALADGQQAFVLDGRWTSKQWSPGLDQKGAELPMLELGFAFTVSDSDKLVQSFVGYRKLVNDLLGIARNFGAPIPEEAWPKPQTAEVGTAKAFYWPLPDLGQDKSIRPNIAVSKNLMTFTLSTGHAQRLHETKAFAADVAALAGGKPVLEAGWMDFAGLIQLARPWVDTFGVPALVAEAQADGPPGLRPADIPAQMATVFEVLGCLKNYTSATYSEPGATVTHSKTVIRDLK
jgi:hypothetical protein